MTGNKVSKFSVVVTAHSDHVVGVTTVVHTVTEIMSDMHPKCMRACIFIAWRFTDL